MTEKEYLPIARAAAYLEVSQGTLRTLADKGLVRHLKLPSGYRRFRVEDLNDFRESHTVGGK